MKTEPLKLTIAEQHAKLYLENVRELIEFAEIQINALKDSIYHEDKSEDVNSELCLVESSLTALDEMGGSIESAFHYFVCEANPELKVPPIALAVS